MRNRTTLLFVAVLISVLVALPVISGCAEEAAAPEAEKVVTFLSLGDYTGPIAGLNVPADTGVGDFFKDLNEKGGINGDIRVNFIGVDTRYDTARGVSAYKRYRTETNLLVVNAISTPFGKAIMPMTAKDKVVQLAPGDGEAQAHIGWVFPWGVCYQNAMGASLDFIMVDWKKKGESGTPKVGYLCWDSAYGREPLRGGAEYAEKLGITLLEPEFFPTGALVEAVGYENIDGEAIKAAYESLTGLDLSQGIVGPCTYSPTNREGADVTKIYQVQNGKNVDISGWLKVPDCVGMHDWSE